MDPFITQIQKKVEKDGVVGTIKAGYRKSINQTNKAISKLGNKRCCYICGKKFSSFNKFKNGSKGTNEFRKRLNGVGSDADNFGCIYCDSNDRERHLFMFFDKLKLWNSLENKRILHFAPEKHLSIKISEQNPVEYIKADLNPARAGILKIDATSVPYSDDTFDFLIANHILEHIPTYHEALAEFYRVIKPKGFAILQTPYSKLLKMNFEDENINTDELRLFFHGQEDHVRTFGEYQFLKSIEEVGFKLHIKKHDEYFNSKDAFYYGVPSKEDLIMVSK